MDYNIRYDYRYETLAAVRRYGSYTLAGGALSLTPSAVSQQIHSIENELNVKLFVKNGSKIIPTKECDIIADYIARIDELCRKMTDDLELSKKNLHHFTVGITPSLENGTLSNILLNYSDTEPDVQIKVVTSSSAALYDMLKNYTVDIAVVEGSFPENEFNSVILDTDYLVAVVSNDNPLAKKEMVSAEELKKEKLILRSADSGTRVLFEANLKKSGLSIKDFNVMMEVESVAAIKKFVESNYGVSVLSNKACKAEAEKGKFRVLPICNMQMTRKINIYYRKDSDYEELLQKIQSLYSQIS